MCCAEINRESHLIMEMTSWNIWQQNLERVQNYSSCNLLAKSFKSTIWQPSDFRVPIFLQVMSKIFFSSSFTGYILMVKELPECVIQNNLLSRLTNICTVYNQMIYHIIRNQNQFVWIHCSSTLQIFKYPIAFISNLYVYMCISCLRIGNEKILWQDLQRVNK